MSAIPSVRLNNGVVMPLLGFGVFQVTDLAECEREVWFAPSPGRVHEASGGEVLEEVVSRAFGACRRDVDGHLHSAAH